MNITSLFKPIVTPAKSNKPDPDYGQNVDSGISDTVKVGAWVGLTTAAGAYIGHQRHLADTVTVEQVPFPETRQVAIGTREARGCYQYHFGYDMMKGEFGYHYGHDSSCRRTVTDYRTEETGVTLIREVEHHSKGFPNTLLQGALLGMGVGLATGVAGLVLAHAISDR